MERVVGRNELRSDEGSPVTSSEPEPIESFNREEEFDFVQPEKSVDQAETIEEDEELDFQLFAAPKASASEEVQPTSHKIRLRSPSIDPANAGFIHPKRDASYYFTKPLSTVEKENVDSATMSGREVLEHARTPWPGSVYSWKVLHVPASNVSKSIRADDSAAFGKFVDLDAAKKRTRPGKKYRIKIRMKHAASKAKREANKAASEAKEAADREKRTRRNREKKVKKKLRDKAKKAGADAEGETSQAQEEDPAAVESDSG